MTNTTLLDETHDPSRCTWVAATSTDATDFPIQNLPFGRFAGGDDGESHLGVAIGDHVLDLVAADSNGLLADHPEPVRAACRAPFVNELASRPAAERTALRRTLSALLAAGSPSEAVARRCLVPRSDARMLLPLDVRNYTDFFTSIDHVKNTSSLVRPGTPVAANFHSLPIAYHGRASTVVVSGTPFHRPHGQYPDDAGNATFGPSRKLDFECELGVVVARGNPMGSRIALADAPGSVFGFCLLNDWSARDIQRWESAPLGPFLGKSFATSISPWLVTVDAMAPFRVAAAERAADAAPLLEYLDDDADRRSGGLDIRMEVSLRSAGMRRQGLMPAVISRPRFHDQYWTVFQMLTHHASNGCAILPGDLMGSGTVSGSRDEELGCLYELLRGGTRTITLPGGETRGFLEDGDELTLAASCEAPGRIAIGFGRCSGIVLPAVQ